MTMRHWVWSGVAVLVLAGFAEMVLSMPIHLPWYTGLRPRTVRNRIECQLEDWGVIRFDLSRHIEG